MAGTLSVDFLENHLEPLHLALLRLVKTEAERLDLPLYIVGGSVRDLLLGRVIKDFDLVVEGDVRQLAEAVLRRFGGKVIFHARFGTATWTLDETTFKRLNVPMFDIADLPPFLDFVSARSEIYSEPGALPTVKRSTIGDDLDRRDFSINAMALRLDNQYFGRLIDPFGGQTDLAHGLIRILHSRSFVDDPTRMFRAVRYMGRYGFEIESWTLTLINKEARDVLSRISGERLRHEIDLMFEEPSPSVMLQRLAELDLLLPIHSSLQHANFQLPFLEALSSEFGEFTVPDIMTFKRTLGWILWLMPLSEFDIDSVSKRLDFPAMLTKSARSASLLLKKLPALASSKPSQWTFYLEELPSISIYAIYLMRREPALRDYLVHWRNVKPTITGNDLRDHGLQPGPKFADILNQLRAAWLDGDVKSKEEEKILLDKLTQ